MGKLMMTQQLNNTRGVNDRAKYITFFQGAGVQVVQVVPCVRVRVSWRIRANTVFSRIIYRQFYTFVLWLSR